MNRRWFLSLLAGLPFIRPAKAAPVIEPFPRIEIPKTGKLIPVPQNIRIINTFDVDDVFHGYISAKAEREVMNIVSRRTRPDDDEVK